MIRNFKHRNAHVWARFLCGRFWLAAVLACGAGCAHAGAQQYEPLSASVQTAMAAAIADQSAPEPKFESVEQRVDWLAFTAQRLPRKWKPEHRERIEFLLSLRYEAQRAGLDPELVLGLVEVESYFRRYAVSSAGARGYTQVMPFWTRVLSDGDATQLFKMRVNLRYGCTILRHYLDIEKGDLFRALGRYNGSLGRPEYPNAVLAAWKKWQMPRKAPAKQ
jgi:soluble lytic murein transglycosylase-like protein